MVTVTFDPKKFLVMPRRPTSSMVTAAGAITNTDRLGDCNNYRRRRIAYYKAMVKEWEECSLSKIVVQKENNT